MKYIYSLFLMLISTTLFAIEFKTFIIEDNPNSTSSLDSFKVFSNGLPYALTSERWDDYEKQRHLLLYSCSDTECSQIKKSRLVALGKSRDKNQVSYELIRREALFENVSGYPVVFLQQDLGDSKKYFTLICKNADCSKYKVEKLTSENDEDDGFFLFHSDKNSFPSAVRVGEKVQCKTQECKKTKKTKWLPKLDKEDEILTEYISNSELIIENFDTDVSRYINCKNDTCSQYNVLKADNNFFRYSCYDNHYALSKLSRKRTVNSYQKVNYVINESLSKINVEKIHACSQLNSNYYVAANFGNEDFTENKLLVCSDPNCNTVIVNLDTKPFGGIKFIDTDKANHVWMANSGYSGIVFLKH